MKMNIRLFYGFMLITSLFMSPALKAQDTIVKTNGEIIYAKILEVGTNAVSYKKMDFQDGPTFVDDKKDIVMIKFHNGQKQEFTKDINTQVPLSPDPGITPAAGKNTLPSSPGATQYRIEHIGKKYTINGQKAKPRDVDNLLRRSDNPAVKVGFKTAKATKVAQKIVGLTSIPTTIGGGVTSVFTFINCFRSPAPSSYINAGLSFLGTLSLPITSKILKKRRDKLYDKVIDLYNVTN